MTGQSRRKLESVAYHEAGHAVASLELGIAVREVNIIPDEGAGRLGICCNSPPGDWFRPDGTDTPRMRRRAEAEIIVLFAGGAAEAKFSGRNNARGARADFAAAADMACHLCGGTDEIDAYLKWLFVRSRNLIARPAQWAAVTALAGKLMDRNRMSGREVRSVVVAAVQRAALNCVAAISGHACPHFDK